MPIDIVPRKNGGFGVSDPDNPGSIILSLDEESEKKTMAEVEEEVRRILENRRKNPPRTSRKGVR
ncbi:MAG: hypothetical protein AAB881_00275 [Patescibacteria group bacterium]